MILLRSLTKRALLCLCLGGTLTGAAAKTPEVPKAPAPKAPEWHILVLGDSQAQGLAAGFMRLYLRQPNIHVLDRSKIGTGLSRANFDWPAEVRKLAATEHADVAVVMFGANDRPVIRLHGKIDQKLADKFTALYGARVADIAATLHGAKIDTIWVGHPQVRDDVYNDDMKILNGLFADGAAKAGVTFFSTWTLFAGTDGKYDAFGKGTDGETTRLRADDGVHLTRAGYDVLARALADKVGPKGK